MNPKEIKVGDKLVWLDPDNVESKVIEVTGFDGLSEDFYLIEKDEDGDGFHCEELHTVDSILCCEKCGKIDVESRAWVFTNSSVFNHNCDDLGHWCKNCGEVNLKTVKQYLDEKFETSVNG